MIFCNKIQNVGPGIGSGPDKSVERICNPIIGVGMQNGNEAPIVVPEGLQNALDGAFLYNTDGTLLLPAG